MALVVTRNFLDTGARYVLSLPRKRGYTDT